MRIIDADALREFFAIHGNEYTGDEMICIAPTISPDSLVKRGRWVLQMGGPHSDIRMYHCSECGFELPYNPKKMPAFCEDCGALMED